MGRESRSVCGPKNTGTTYVITSRTIIVKNTQFRLSRITVLYDFLTVI